MALIKHRKRQKFKNSFTVFSHAKISWHHYYREGKSRDPLLGGF